MEKLNRVFDRVALSREREEALLADLLREKQEVSGMKQKKHIHKAALIVAVLVIALAGSALAERYSGRLDVAPFDGESYENGYSIQGAYQNIPLERLSKAALERAAQLESGMDELAFDSWEEAEAFLGLELANNWLLEEMERSEGESPYEDGIPCTVHMSCSRGIPDIIWLRDSYFSGDMADFDFSVTETAYMRVRNEDHGDLPFTVSMPYECICVDEYVTSGGLEVTVFSAESTVTGQDGIGQPRNTYFACFTMNNAIFELSTHFSDESADEVLQLLKDVLDAYE